MHAKDGGKKALLRDCGLEVTYHSKGAEVDCHCLHQVAEGTVKLLPVS